MEEVWTICNDGERCQGAVLRVGVPDESARGSSVVVAPSGGGVGRNQLEGTLTRGADRKIVCQVVHRFSARSRERGRGRHAGQLDDFFFALCASSALARRLPCRKTRSGRVAKKRGIRYAACPSGALDMADDDLSTVVRRLHHIFDEIHHVDKCIRLLQDIAITTHEPQGSSALRLQIEPARWFRPEALARPDSSA